MQDTDHQKSETVSPAKSLLQSPVMAESSPEMNQNEEGEKITICLVYGKEKFSMQVYSGESVVEFKRKVEELTGVPPSMQKLMFKNVLRDGMKLCDCKVENGSKIMLIGSKIIDVIAVNIKPNPLDLKDKVTPREPIGRQQQHLRVLANGVPNDAMLGIKNVNDPLPEVPITGLRNKSGGKVSLMFKLEMDQIWIGTAELTEKLSMAQINGIISEPIEGHEEYSIMAFQLGPTEQSRLFLYWVPSQYVVAIRKTILGAF